MRRPILAHYRPLFVAILVIAASGCAQTSRSFSPMTWLRKPEPKVAESEAAPAETAAEDAKPKEEQTAKKEEPAPAKVEVADTPEAAPAAEPLPTIEPAAVADASAAKPAEVPAADNKAGITHDAETLALIDAELKQASSEEREKLFAEWKTLDSAMIRQVIRIRKMVRELESSSPSATAATSATPGSLPGAADPWNDKGTPPEGGRVTALGAPEAAQTTANAESTPQIQPAGHEVPAAGGTAVALAEAIPTAAPEVNANSPVTTAGAPASRTPGDDAWTNQLRELITLAEVRAEQARVAFLDGGPQAAADDNTRRRYVESQVHLRILHLMAGDQARAMQAIPGLAAPDQEFWQQVLWGVANYFDAGTLPKHADRVTHTIEQLRTAISRLQGEANLQLRNVAFCHKITSFGNFERFERDEYSAGQRVLLYAEILNFKSEPQAADGLFKTQLKSTIEVFRTGQEAAVKKIEFDPTVDLCRSYRQDYFHSYELRIPPDLTAGPHSLRLTVEDIQSGKQATYTLNFAVK